MGGNGGRGELNKPNLLLNMGTCVREWKKSQEDEG